MTTEEDFLKMLEHSFLIQCEHECFCGNGDYSKLEYLGENIFSFVTYESEFVSKMAKWAIDTCVAISDRKTFEMVDDDEAGNWYLIMVNMPFFESKLEWGSSIRGAWWEDSSGIKINSYGLYDGEEQVLELFLEKGEMVNFSRAMYKFISS